MVYYLRINVGLNWLYFEYIKQREITNKMMHIIAKIILLRMCDYFNGASGVVIR